MRFPEDKIKEAILHPDPEIRGRATAFFAKSYSPDPTIMPLVIKTIATYGRESAYRLIGLARDLQQTEDTIAWVINEHYPHNLSMLLLEADPTLLLPRETAVLQARHFFPGLRSSITERLGMLSWDAATCWQKLEEFCEEGKDKRYVEDVNLGHARQIVEALARYGKVCEEKVRAILTQKVEDFSHSPMKWLEPLAVRLAGEARLESTIPLLISKLHEDADLLNEECAKALTKIGTPAVLEAVGGAFPQAERHFRLHAIIPLDHIHSDLAVETCLKLLAQEEDEQFRRKLAHALLCHFGREGIEIACQLLVGRELDFEDKCLRNYLLETCTIMEERFPEYDEWLGIAKAEHAEHWEKAEELVAEIAEKKLEIERLKAEIAKNEKMLADQARPPATRSIPLSPHSQIARIASSGSGKIGRNDPCPCGSGKKYKACCLNKQRGF